MVREVTGMGPDKKTSKSSIELQEKKNGPKTSASTFTEISTTTVTPMPTPTTTSGEYLGKKVKSYKQTMVKKYRKNKIKKF